MKCLVSCVQFNPKLLDVENNLKVAYALTYEAARKGSRIIVLPELSFSGFSLQNKNEATQCSQDMHGYQTILFEELTRKFNCWIVFGYVEFYNGQLFNSAAILGPRGLVGNVRKHNLWGSDVLWATASEESFRTHTTPYGRLGVLICRDAKNNYRESYKYYDVGSRYYRKGDVDIIALPTNCRCDVFPNVEWVELAEQTSTNVLVSNRVGKENNMIFHGGSCIIDKNLQVLSQEQTQLQDNIIVGGEIEC